MILDAGVDRVGLSALRPVTGLIILPILPAPRNPR
jgi:hypothetical protein